MPFFEFFLLRASQLIWPGTDFLQAKQIRVVFFPPLIGAIFESCPNSIDVPGSNREHFLIVTDAGELRGHNNLKGLFR
jgi:hypothetical protein